MSTAVMLNAPQLHRKPVGSQRSYNDMQQQAPAPSQYTDSYPPRISSSNPSPGPEYASQAPPPPMQQPNSTRFSTASSTSTMNSSIQRMPTNSSSIPRRSTSSRSNGTTASATSYVALMRKQKATVWCDRAQHEDPRILAKQRLDKQRAAMEVAGGRHHGSRVSTSSSTPSGNNGLRSKIRHPGGHKAQTYLGGANMSGAGVPVRLSATEMEEDTNDAKVGRHGPGGGSGRSSGSSGLRASSDLGVAGLNRSNNPSPPDEHSPSGSMGYLADERTPVPNQTNMSLNDYFEGVAGDDTAEAEQNFGGIAGLPPSKPRTEHDLKREEDLRRRGSVDDRTMTMSGQRLFVANPDLSD